MDIRGTMLRTQELHTCRQGTGICVNLGGVTTVAGAVTRLPYTGLLVVLTGHVRQIGLQLRTEYIVTLGIGDM